MMRIWTFAGAGWRYLGRGLGALLAGAAMTLAHAAVLEVELGEGRGVQRLDTQTLASHPAARDIEVPRDVAYHRPMRYRALPLAVLLPAAALQTGDSVEVVATDGFRAQLPEALLRPSRPGQPEPWLAVELPQAPWPALPGKSATAGPFYVVWPDDAGVRSEQWPYAVARLQRRQAPEVRWPQLRVAASLPAQAVARRGQAVFVTQCLVCHRMNGAGEATVGPDLNLPMNPTEYFQPQALRRLIRDPASVRHWPGRAMPAFDPAQLSDQELDDVLAYLGHMAGQRGAAR